MTQKYKTHRPEEHIPERLSESDNLEALIVYLSTIKMRNHWINVACIIHYIRVFPTAFKEYPLFSGRIPDPMFTVYNRPWFYFLPKSTLSGQAVPLNTGAIPGQSGGEQKMSF